MTGQLNHIFARVRARGAKKRGHHLIDPLAVSFNPRVMEGMALGFEKDLAGGGQERGGDGHGVRPGKPDNAQAADSQRRGNSDDGVLRDIHECMWVLNRGTPAGEPVSG